MKKRQLFINAAAAVLAVGAGLLLTKLLPQENPYPVLAEDVHDSGNCGTNATWEFDSQTGVLEISGSGSISSYSSESQPWYEYRGYITSVVVSNEITDIPNETFRGLGKLENLTVPFIGKARMYGSGQNGSQLGAMFSNTSFTDSVKVVQYYSSSSSYSYYLPKALNSVTVTNAYRLSYGAFNNCSMIHEIVLNDDIVEFNSSVFSNCTKLESVNIPSTCTSIPYNFFQGCSSLSSIELPNGITSIGSQAFYNCSSLAEINYPSSLQSISQQAFYGCSSLPNELIFEEGLLVIGEQAFYNCTSLTDIEFPSSLHTINPNAFSGCVNVENISFSEGLKTIAQTAFKGLKKLESVELPDSITSIGNGAFSGCSGLKKMVLPFVGGLDATSLYPQNQANCFGYIFGSSSYTGGTGVSQKYLFDSSYSFYIPSGLTNVTITKQTVIPFGAFYGCSMLKEVELNEGITGIGSYAFYNCSNLYKINIPKTVTVLNTYCFYGCTKITDIIIPENVTIIFDYAFYGCTSLRTVEFPEGLTEIRSNAFGNCSALIEINTPSTLTSFGDNSFSGCVSVEHLNLPEGLKTIGANAFKGMKLIEYIEVPKSVTDIGGGAFNGWAGLREMVLPFVGSYRTTTSSGSSDGYLFGFIFGTSSYTGGTNTYQYYDSSSSRTYCIPTSLRKVTITDENTITYGAFYGCGMIKELVLNDSIVAVLDKAFYGLGMISESTEDFVVSGSVLLKYKGSARSRIIIPEGISIIAPYAFQIYSDQNYSADPSYLSISISKSTSYIGAYAFYNLTACTITVPKMSGSLTIGTNGFGKVLAVSYLDTFTYSNGNDTYYYSVNGTTACINKCITTSVAITLPSTLGGYTVVSVGFMGMANCTSLTSVTIPYSIQELGEYAFYKCTGITTVTIPSTVLSIGEYAFAECTSLSTVTIAEGVEYIGDFAFYKCTSLFEIVIPDSVVYLGSYCFYNCTSLESASLGISVEDILSHTFYNCNNLATVTIGSSVRTIGDYAFYGCALNRVTTPPSLISIGNFAFAFNSNLNRITLRNNLESIGKGAFYYCISLDNVTLPSKISSIEDYCFGYCVSLTTFVHSGDLTKIGSFAFTNSNIETFVFNEGLIEIGDVAFKNTKFTSVYLPNSLVYLGGDAFAGCKELSDVSIPDSVAHVGAYAFYDNNHLHVAIRYNTGYVADYILYASSVYTVDIDDQITAIGNSAFSNCYFLYSVKLPAYLESIGSKAFYRCYSLKNLTMPDTVQSIGSDAFAQDYNISITITLVDGEIADYLFEEQFIYHVYISNGIYSIGARAFANCPNLIDVSLSDEVEAIGELCFQSDENLWIYIRFFDGVIDDYVFQDCNTVTRFFVESGIHTIGEHAFDSCKALQRMDLPNTVQIIGSYAFYDCNSMTYINIPTGVQIINDHVFFGCASLESIDLPNTFKSIEDYAFYGCIKLKQIYVSDICTKIGSYAFYNCKSLESINIKSSIKIIGDYAFRSCVLLSEIRIGDNVTSLGMCAFYDCNGLETVYLGKGIYELKDRLFYGCVNLTDLYLYAPQAYIDELAFYGAEDVTVHIGHDAYMESYFNENGINYVIDESIIYEYRIVFLDENGDVIYEGTYHYGDTVDIPDDPTKPADNTYTYTFAGWDKTVTTVNGNTTYTATYTKTYIEYTVTFYDENGTVISSQTYHYGDTIVAPADPTKAADNTYTYSFAGWDNVVDTCTGNLEFTATYSRTYIEYTVTFVDENGTVISTQTYHYGDEIDIPADPTKAADNTYTYSFAGWNTAISPACTGNATYTATYSRTYIEYTVTFYDENGNVISSQTYHYGDIINAPANPTKAADNTYTYTFAGWGEEVGVCTGNIEYEAQFTRTYIEYTVTFYNEDGTIISNETYHYGDEVEIPNNPTKAADNTYTYSFSGWDKTVTNVTGNAEYTATYNRTYIEYTITFVDENGIVISTRTYHYGDEVEIPANPTKPADNTYTYSFAGWDKNVSATVTGNATYTATYSRTYIDYTVTFYNEDGTVISTQIPANPTKASDNTYSYSFVGWDSVVTVVNGNASYTATYNRTYIEYTVTFVDENGTVISTSTYHYGDEIETPTNPTKSADNTYTYEFAGWDSEVGTCSGNMTFTATYSRTYIDYTVTFYNEDGTVISTQTYHYGDEIESPLTPSKTSDNTYTYTFAGWDKELGTCTGNMTFTATYSSTYIEYIVTFVDEDGTVISTQTYHYGDEVEVPADPTKAADSTYTYSFSGWDKTVVTVDGNTTYTATYSRTYIEYTVTFVDEDGTVISTQTYHYGDEIEAPANPTKPSDDTYDYTFAGWDNEVGTCSGNMTFTATYTKEYSKEYLSGQLRDQLLEEISGVTDIDLSTYSTIADIESRMNDLTDTDRATVQAELDKLIQKYNNFVNSINAEFEESVSVTNKWLFGAIVSSISLLSVAAFFLRRRLPL